jgi:hypothetical protein
LKILFVTPKLPSPNGSQEQQRTHRFIRELTQGGHQVDLCSFVQSRRNHKEIARLGRSCRQIKTVWNSAFWAFFKMVLGLLALTPFRVLACTSVRMHFLLKRMMEKNHYDVVHLVSARMMEFSPCFEGHPVLVDHIHGLAPTRSGKVGKKARRSFNPIGLFEGFKTRRYERRIRNRHSYALTADATSAKNLDYSRVNVLSDAWEMSSSKVLADNYGRAIRINRAWLQEKKQGIVPLDVYHQEKIAIRNDRRSSIGRPFASDF